MVCASLPNNVSIPLSFCSLVRLSKHPLSDGYTSKETTSPIPIIFPVLFFMYLLRNQSNNPLLSEMTKNVMPWFIPIRSFNHHWSVRPNTSFFLHLKYEEIRYIATETPTHECHKFPLVASFSLSQMGMSNSFPDIFNAWISRTDWNNRNLTNSHLSKRTNKQCFSGEFCCTCLLPAHTGRYQKLERLFHFWSYRFAVTNQILFAQSHPASHLLPHKAQCSDQLITTRVHRWTQILSPSPVSNCPSRFIILHQTGPESRFLMYHFVHSSCLFPFFLSHSVYLRLLTSTQCAVRKFTQRSNRQSFDSTNHSSIRPSIHLSVLCKRLNVHIWKPIRCFLNSLINSDFLNSITQIMVSKSGGNDKIQNFWSSILLACILFRCT